MTPSFNSLSFFLSPLSSLTVTVNTCFFSAKNPHSVLIESDRPQKRPFGFSFHFISFSLPSWRSRTTCHSCRLIPIGSCFWVIGVLLQFCKTELKNKTFYLLLFFYFRGLFFFSFSFFFLLNLFGEVVEVLFDFCFWSWCCWFCWVWSALVW